MARLGVPVGGRVRKLRAVEDQSDPIPEERTSKLEGSFVVSFDVCVRGLTRLPPKRSGKTENSEKDVVGCFSMLPDRVLSRGAQKSGWITRCASQDEFRSTCVQTRLNPIWHDPRRANPRKNGRIRRTILLMDRAGFACSSSRAVADGCQDVPDD